MRFFDRKQVERPESQSSNQGDTAKVHPLEIATRSAAARQDNHPATTNLPAHSNDLPSNRPIKSNLFAKRALYSAFTLVSVVGMALLMPYYRNNDDKNLFFPSLTLLTVCSLAFGAFYRLLINTFDTFTNLAHIKYLGSILKSLSPKPWRVSLKHLHDLFDKIKPEEIAAQAIIIDTFTGGWRSPSGKLLLAIWGGIRTGMIMLTLALQIIREYKHKKPLSNSSTADPAEIPYTPPSMWTLKNLLWLVSAGVLLATGSFGLSLAGSVFWAIPGTTLADAGLAMLGITFGRYIERFFSNYNKNIGRIIRLFFYSMVTPGAAIQDFIRVAILGILLGHNYAATLRESFEHSKTVNKQIPELRTLKSNPANIDFFNQIQENLKAAGLLKDTDEYKSYRKKIYILQAVASFIPFLAFAVLRDSAIFFRHCMSYFLLATYYLARALHLSPIDSYKPTQTPQASTPTTSANTLKQQMIDSARYFFCKNPLPAAVIYAFVVRWWQKLYFEGVADEHPIRRWLFSPLTYLFFCVLWGIKRAASNEVPHLSDDKMLAINQHFNAQETTPLKLTLGEQKFIHDGTKDTAPVARTDEKSTVVVPVSVSAAESRYSLWQQQPPPQQTQRHFVTVQASSTQSKADHVLMGGAFVADATAAVAPFLAPR